MFSAARTVGLPEHELRLRPVSPHQLQGTSVDVSVLPLSSVVQNARLQWCTTDEEREIIFAGAEVLAHPLSVLHVSSLTLAHSRLCPRLKTRLLSFL